ncbi:GtrA family protein [Helicobacter saguini]|uniref:GtrA family protein n=1 Tax=Helicobacter saguini TaxID=1548018 RepID=A0A6B0HYC8_9HELI|nr:GtrA family protein [Helicobacter saguini]MWV61972.1 GtrA family protein [Helicobacter saguini]MWV67353.1 GtrA family protein [Helicobacter saguini]MWV69706.1 GtrA family protein [Helicobacter saguini]MWV73077.1 GtrA family protein [Helicobacter saguini]
MKILTSNFIKYLFVGGSAALVNWAVFFIFNDILKFHYLFAGFLSFIIATLWNFIFAKKFIFINSKHTLFKETFFIYLASFLGLLIDMSMLYVCVQFFLMPPLLGKILATGLAFIFNFSIRHFVIYKLS